MLSRAGEAESLYSGSFQDRRVLSFMYESFREGPETQDKHNGRPSTFLRAAPSPLRSTLVAHVART